MGGANPAPQQFNVKNSGRGRLKYTIQAKESWLSVTPIKGVSKGEWDTLTVSVDAEGLGAGIYQGAVEVACKDVLNSPKIINVVLTVTEPD